MRVGVLITLLSALPGLCLTAKLVSESVGDRAAEGRPVRADAESREKCA